MTSASHNLLVVSDLHLGEDIGAPVGEGEHPHLALTEQALTAFVDHHTATREHDRPWHLVVNGDMVDFLAMIVMPADAGVLTGLDDDDHWYGLGTTEAAAGAKLDRVVARHDSVFCAMAHFVAGGNRLTVIIGNHDVEFHWPTAQQRFRAHLLALDAGADGSRIAFHPWFYFDGSVWIEHGHLYDPYCTVEDVLDPFTDDGQDLHPSLAAFTMRYMNNHFAPHAGHSEPWGMVGYLSWFGQQGVARMAAILSAFGQMTMRAMRVAAAAASPSAIRRQRRARHLARLRALAERYQLDPEAVATVDALQHKPVLVDRHAVIRALMLDQLLVAVAAVLIVTSALFVLPWAAFAGTAALLAAAAIALHHRLSHRREAAINTARLRRVAGRIRDAMRARIVVFGHTHDPVATEDENGWTFNTGSWVPDNKRGLRRAFTHLRIIRGPDGGEVATLCRWRNGRSEPISA